MNGHRRLTIQLRALTAAEPLVTAPTDDLQWLREQVAAAETAASALPPVPAAAPHLSAAELAFFERFGYIHRRQLFTPAEMDTMCTETAVEGFNGVASLAGTPALSQLLLEEERILGPMEQLLGKRVMLVGAGVGGGGFGPDMWEGRAEAGLPEDYQEHGWHSDYPGASEVALPRIKSMIYLQDTKRQFGSLRLLPASHTAEAQTRLRRIQAFHGVCTGHQRWVDGTYRVTGDDLPGIAAEVTLGDQVRFF